MEHLRDKTDDLTQTEGRTDTYINRWLISTGGTNQDRANLYSSMLLDICSEAVCSDTFTQVVCDESFSSCCVAWTPENVSVVVCGRAETNPQLVFTELQRRCGQSSHGQSVSQSVWTDYNTDNNEQTEINMTSKRLCALQRPEISLLLFTSSHDMQRSQHWSQIRPHTNTINTSVFTVQSCFPYTQA